MKHFGIAFKEHVDATETSVAAVARATGISKGQLYKLYQGAAKSTNCEDAVLIANYFGKTVEDFIETAPDPALTAVLTLLRGLSPEEIETALRVIEAVSARKDNAPR